MSPLFRWPNSVNHVINTYPEIGFDGTEFEIRLGMTIDVHVGGNNHWDALVTFVNEHTSDQLYKNIERLKEETGTVWRTSEGEVKFMINIAPPANCC